MLVQLLNRMKTNRILVITSAFFMMTITAACEATHSAVPLNVDPSTTSSLVIPSVIPTAESTTESSPVTTELPEGMYINTEYLFAFEIPEGWSLEELTWEEMEGEEPHRAVVLTSEPYEIIMEYNLPQICLWVWCHRGNWAWCECLSGGNGWDSECGGSSWGGWISNWSSRWCRGSVHTTTQ